MWCWIEVVLFYSMIVSGSIFTFARSFTKLPITIQGNTLRGKNVNHDFLEVESLLIELFSMIAAPFLMSLMLNHMCFYAFTDARY